MRFLTRSLIALLLAAVALGLLGLAAGTLQSTLRDRAEQAGRPMMARERVFAARVVTIAPAQVAPVLSAFGDVRARRVLELRAPLAGRVQEIAPGMENGAVVGAGQWLVRLDPADAEAALALARNDMARAEAERREAERALDLSRLDRGEAEAQADLRARALDRRRSLAERGVATEAMIEEAELAFAAARAAVIARRQSEAQAEARLDQAATALARQQITLSEAERRLTETVISAPFDGVLSNVTVVTGGTVGNNERLASVIDPDNLEVGFRLSTAQYLRLLDPQGGLIGLPGEVALELGSLQISSPIRLTRADPSVGEGQTGRLVFAQVLSPRGFRPGDFVVVRLTEPPLDAVALLPATAVDAEGGVLILGDEDRLQAAQVEVLRRQGDQVLVRAPDLAGREVVAVRNPLLGAGIRIRPQRDSAIATPAAAIVPPPAPEMVALDSDRRAALIAQVTANANMPPQVRSRILAQLEQDQVPAQLLQRLESGPRGG